MVKETTPVPSNKTKTPSSPQKSPKITSTRSLVSLNGDFSSVVAQQKARITGVWATYQENAASVLSYETVGGINNSSCVKIVNAGSQSCWIQGFESFEIGKKYTFESMVRTENVTSGEGAFTAILCINQNSQIVGSVNAKANSTSNSWIKSSASITIPEGTTYVSLELVMRSVGSAWFDNAYFYKE